MTGLPLSSGILAYSPPGIKNVSRYVRIIKINMITVAVIKDEQVDEYIKVIGINYRRAFGHEASFYVSEIGDGGKEV